MNLGWKLAAAIQGWGGELLLDSYHQERHRVGRQVLRSSGALIRLALIRPRWGRQLRNVIGQLLMGLPPVAASVDRPPQVDAAVTAVPTGPARARPSRRLPGLGGDGHGVPGLGPPVLPADGADSPLAAAAGQLVDTERLTCRLCRPR